MRLLFLVRGIGKGLDWLRRKFGNKFQSIVFFAPSLLVACGSDPELDTASGSLAQVSGEQLPKGLKKLRSFSGAADLVNNEAPERLSLQSLEKPPGDFLKLCEGVSGSERSVLLGELGKFGAQGFGTRKIEPKTLAVSQESCALGLLPAALYTNLRTGVPASILLGQAIQETGWCRSELSQKGRNVHGQKSKFEKSYFSFWPGESILIYSSEDSSGDGNKVLSRFMKFNHVDHSFYSVAERFLVPDLPYKACMSKRSDSAAFIRCIGKSWAVHSDYADVVLGHRANFRSDARPKLRLNKCDLPVNEWSLHQKFK